MAFKAKDGKAVVSDDASFVIWTTTPWTLPSNVALCVGPKIEYDVVETYNPYDAEKLTIRYRFKAAF